MSLFKRLFLLQSRRVRNRRERSRRDSRRRIFQRKLRTESLETRQLLAGDVFHHNHFDPEDVNDDGIVSAVDALVIVNSMNRRDAGGGFFTDVNNDGQQTALDALRVVNRINRGSPDPSSTGRGPGGNGSDGRPGDHGPQGPLDPPSTDETISEFRTFDGTGNNEDNPLLGSAGQALGRAAEADYEDGISEPAGADRPSTREISNLLSAADEAGTRNDRDLSAFVYVWGQFLDHDIDHTPTPEAASEQESFDIEVPTGDAFFDPFATGSETISLTRSAFDDATGFSVDNPREQISDITAWIDGSQVYGSDQETADSLREFSGGRMLISEDGLLPTDEDGNVMAGDVRAAENPALTSLQTLFVREHNRLADQIAAENPGLEDEDIYQQARMLVIAEIQAITYNEYLPALLGNRAIDGYSGYDSSVDPTIVNEFSTAAFRFGHSTLNGDIEFFGNDGRAVRDDITLADAFFNSALLEETGIDSILKYDASTLSQEVDLQVVDELRNFLFGPPGAGGLDLVALNIQRGRDHGLADYNSTRAAYGLDEVTSFEEITSDVELQQKLESLYGDVNDIDLWVGLMAEDHTRGASVGELTGVIIADQFERLRDGDRFWYENVFSGGELRELDNTTLASVIERNTDVEGLQDNVFFFRAEISGTVVAAAPAVSGATDFSRESSRERGGSRRETGLSGVEVELLNDSGDVVETTVTNARGEYRFGSFAETGDYQVRLASTDAESAASEAVDILISTGNQRVRGVDFVV